MSQEHIRRLGCILFGFGIALLGEHIVNHGGTDWTINCHGTIGLVCIVVSFLLLLKRESVNSENTH